MLALKRVIALIYRLNFNLLRVTFAENRRDVGIPKYGITDYEVFLLAIWQSLARAVEHRNSDSHI